MSRENKERFLKEHQVRRMARQAESAPVGGPDFGDFKVLPSLTEPLKRTVFAALTLVGLKTPGAAVPRSATGSDAALEHGQAATSQTGIPRPEIVDQRAEQAQASNLALYKIEPKKFYQLGTAIFGEGGLAGLQRLQKFLKLNQGRNNWGSDLVFLDSDLVRVINKTTAKSLLNENGFMNKMIGGYGWTTSVEEQREATALAMNTYGGKVKTQGLMGIWGAQSGVSGGMTKENPGKPLVLVTKQVCSSKSVPVQDSRGGKAFAALLEAPNIRTINLASGETVEICCVENVPFPSVAINGPDGRHLRVVNLETGAEYPWGQWPVEPTPTPKPTPTPEKPKSASVDVISDVFDGKKVVVTDQKRLDQARDYFFNKWFGKTTGWVDAFLPRSLPDRSNWVNIKARFDLSKGIKVNFLNIDQLMQEEKSGYQEAIALVNEVGARYDVDKNGQFLIEVFLRVPYAPNAAPILSFAMTRARDIYIPSDSDIELWKILVGDYPVNKGGKAENFNFCLKLL